MTKKRKIVPRLAKNRIKLSGKFPKKGQEIIKTLPFVKYIYLSIVVNFLIITAIFVVKKNLPPEVPLFYGLPKSENQLVPSTSLILPSLISLAIIALNSFLAYLTKDEFLKKTLVMATFASTFFSVVTTLKIVFLVGSF